MNILDEFLNSLLSTINFNQSDEAVISQLNLLEEQVRNIAQQNDSLGHFYQGQYLTVGQLNGVIAESIKRLKLLFSYSQAAETKIVNRLNNTVVTINNVSSEAKRIGTKLKRLMLNNGIGLINFIEDFASSENIENESTMSIDFIESAATLPIESQTSLTPRSIEFNTNGVVGSNNEVGRLLSGDSINNLLDNNLGTWFEVESLDGPVELTISYTFETAELVNFIRIVPVLFSTGNPLKIKDIKFITATQEEYSLGSDIITLVSDENSGTFSFSTHPCTLKKIIFVFKQDNPYLIQTPRGVVNRYAIGLKELSVYRIAYKTQGNVILKLPDNQTVESFKVNYEHKDLNLFSESVAFSKDKISLTSEPNQDSKFLHLNLQRKDSAFSNPLTFFSKM